MSDWMPTTNQGKIEMARVWLNVLLEKAAAWGVPVKVIEDMELLTADAEDAQAKAISSTASTPDRKHRDRMIAQLEVFMRDTKKRYFLSPPLVLEDYPKLLLSTPDTNPTPHEPPETVPEIEVITAVIRQLSFRMRDFGAKTWAKPDKVHAMQLAYYVGNSPPADVNAYPNKESESANPIVLSFTEADRGKRVHFAGRWLSSTEKPGPWGEAYSAVIP